MCRKNKYAYCGHEEFVEPYCPKECITVEKFEMWDWCHGESCKPAREEAEAQLRKEPAKYAFSKDAGHARKEARASVLGPEIVRKYQAEVAAQEALQWDALQREAKEREDREQGAETWARGQEIIAKYGEAAREREPRLREEEERKQREKGEQERQRHNSYNKEWARKRRNAGKSPDSKAKK
ncbi:hypothetical protein V8E51_002474 [Hyaloscypha variabilis]